MESVISIGINDTSLGHDALVEVVESNIVYHLLARVLLTFVMFTLACELWFRNTHKYKALKNMPAPMRLPLVGNGHLVLGLNNRELMKKALEYFHRLGDVICGTLGYKFMVFLSNPADMEIILNSQVHLEKSTEYKFFEPWFGDGLLISKGSHWRHHRKMIAPTFHQSILKSFVPTFVRHSRAIADKLTQYGNSEFDVHDDMSEVTVEILLSTVMGLKKIPNGRACAKYAQAVLKMCDIIHNRQLKFIYRLDMLYKYTKMRAVADRMMDIIQSMTRKVIVDRMNDFNADRDCVRDEPENIQAAKVSTEKKGLHDDLDDIDDAVGVKSRLALLDAMVEMTKNPNVEWTEKDVRDEVNTIMFEGHDTTSAGTSFVLCLLGIHKDVQQKVIDEQRAIFGNDFQRDCTFADTLEMNYLERVIKETLRLYPPVPVIARVVAEDVQLASGPYTIPAGTTVVLSSYTAHRCKKIYNNPEKFDPDNFLPERVSKRHYYSFIPFSAGPRSCVGRKYAMLMLKVLLSTLIRKFEVQCNMKESEFAMQGDIILKMSNGFKIALNPRV